jgi:excisionase family DNA binding protein
MPPKSRNREESTYYTAQELADVLEVSVQSVYTFLQRGYFPSMRVGHQYRIPKRAIDELIARATTNAR